MATPTTIVSTLRQTYPDGSDATMDPVSYKIVYDSSMSTFSVSYDHTNAPPMTMNELTQMYHEAKTGYHSQLTTFVMTIGAKALNNIVKETPADFGSNLFALGLRANSTFDQWNEQDQAQRISHATLSAATTSGRDRFVSDCWNKILRLQVHETFA